MTTLTRTTRNGLLSRDPFALARDLFGEPWPNPTRQELRFAPGFDVKETETAYVLIADMPGVKNEDIDISLSGNQLTIAGRRETEDKREGESYHVVERTAGSFSRTFVLPKQADGDAVSADLKNGVLTVTVGKRTEAQPRKIAINVES